VLPSNAKSLHTPVVAMVAITIVGLYNGSEQHFLSFLGKFFFFFFK
jgi:hypothetical protein